MEYGEGGLDLLRLERERRARSGSGGGPGLLGSILGGTADAERVTGPPGADCDSESPDGVHELGPFLGGAASASSSAATFFGRR